jgi:Lhr-like helicase
MNALANSQREEIDKFIGQSGLPDHMRPTFARYTGQESDDEREQIKEAKPDILLTNFMMLELLMTRQSRLDRAVIANAHGLDFLVLDELHTYRGRQSADVAMLVRRVRDRLCPERQPVCIGTSATMASEGGDAERAAAIASVSSRLFGTTITPDAVIGESLERATDHKLKSTTLGAALKAAVIEDLPAKLDDEALRGHPLAVWCELDGKACATPGRSRRRRGNALPQLSSSRLRVGSKSACAASRCWCAAARGAGWRAN